MRSKDQQLLDDIFDYIVKYKSENDISPSNTDVANQFGLHRSKANRYIQELQTQGKLQINGHRSIRIVSDEFTEPTVKVPLLGNIACGAPIFADGTVRDYQRIPESWQGVFSFNGTGRFNDKCRHRSRRSGACGSDKHGR